MSIIHIENIGKLGIATDIPAHELPLEAWSDGLNMRFFNGKAIKVGGEAGIYSAPTVAPHWLLPWDSISGFRWIYGGVEQVHYVVSSGTSTNITRYTTTPGDDDYDAGARPEWSGGVLHGLPIINNNNGVDYPQQWDASNNRLKDLTNWPANAYCDAMRPFGNFLVALNITTASGNFPYTVKWSHPADPGTVPASWDETDASKLAGVKALSETTGFAVDCKPLFGSNIVYKTDAIYVMRLSNSQYVFNFELVSPSQGVLCKNCVVEVFGRHFVVGQNDIYLFDGRKADSIINGRNRDYFFDNLNATYWNKTHAVVNYPKQEVWVCYVSVNSSDNYLDMALIWNWALNTWSFKELPQIAYSATGEALTDTSDTFDAASGTFNTDFGPFDTAGTPANRQIVHARALATAKFLKADETYQSDGTDTNSFLERTGLAIAGADRQGQPKVDPSSLKFVRAVFPKISAPSSVTLQISVGMQDVVGGPVTWEGPFDFVVGTDVRVDCALQGRFFAIRIEETGDSPWELTGYALDLDVIAQGVN